MSNAPRSGGLKASGTARFRGRLLVFESSANPKVTEAFRGLTAELKKHDMSVEVISASPSPIDPRAMLMRARYEIGRDGALILLNRDGATLARWPGSVQLPAAATILELATTRSEPAASMSG